MDLRRARADAEPGPPRAPLTPGGPAGSGRAARRAAELRFYAELNDFLPHGLRYRNFAYTFDGTPSVKDAIEANGVPHTEVDLVLIDGESVDFRWRLTGGEHVAVYPVFERFDIARVTRLRPRPLRRTRFVLDVHLGRLARCLRMLGFDALYRNDYADAEIVRLSLAERRIILTRDKGLLKHGAVTHGHWLRATSWREQAREVLRAFDLARAVRPFVRCLACNGRLVSIDRKAAAESVPARVAARFRRFRQCRDCARIYWPGSHHERMRRLVAELVAGG